MTKPFMNLVWLLICSLITIKPFETYGFSIKLMPIDQFDKSLFPENLTLKERYRRMSDISRTRVHQLELSTPSPSAMERKESTGHDPNALKPTVTKHPIIGYYITSVMVGTPSYFPNLIVDTGSDDTWMQCEGCTTCFPLRQGNFDRSKSIAYQPLSCEDPLCVPRLCSYGRCAYDKHYDGISHALYSRGQVGSDTFIFQDGNRSVKGFPRTVFGCGLDNYNMPWGKLKENNTVSGILGLGLGKRSIFTQYANETKRRISYCLPSWYNHRQSTYTLLNFGDDAQIGGHPGSVVQKTALISRAGGYKVNVMGISIKQKRLNINPAVFRIRPDGTGGFQIDSGSPSSVLVQIAYDAVKEEITRYFRDKYSWHPIPPRPGKYDLCYEVPRGNYTYPTMTYHFSRAHLFLPAKNMFRTVEGGFCFVITPNPNGELNLLGAFQQVDHRFLFDFERSRASFVPEVCEVN